MNFYSALLPHAATLTKADILTYHALGDLGGETHCAVWQDEIAAKAGVSPRQVRRSLSHLEAVGLITVDRSNRYHHVYHFTYAVPAAEAGKASPPDRTGLCPPQ